VTNPKILFLDEPMLGLDPKSVKWAIKFLLNLNKTVFLTSHQMNVVSKLCERIAFLKAGEIIKIDTQDNFKKLISQEIRINLEISNQRQELIESLNQLGFIKEIEKSSKSILLIIESEEYLPKLFSVLKDYPVTNFNQKEPSLDDVFIRLSK
jgi:ABC-2 type transport system ATP-binding protein